MRIVCPACSAAYEVPVRLLGAGRPVRCARCGHEWMPEAATEPDAAPQAAPGAGTQEAPPVPQPRPSIVERSGERPVPEADAPVAVMEPPPGAPPPHALVARADSPDEDPDGLVPPAEADAENIADVGDSRRPDTLIRLAWTASVLAILLLGWAGYEWRAPIMHAWPASERLYAALGLAGG